MDKDLNGIPGISGKISSLKSNIKKHIKGKDEVIDNCLCALFSKGHVLIEDIPGVGKTTLAHTLALSQLRVATLRFSNGSERKVALGTT